MPLFRSIAVFAALATAPLPAIGQGTILPPKPDRTAVLIDSVSLRALKQRVTPRPPAGGTSDGPQVPTIPLVLGKLVSEAINLLTWTELRIVQIESTNTDYRAGIVFRQRPEAGTPVSRARAETLYVAAAQRSPPHRKENPWWLAPLESALVKRPRKPPPPQQGPNIASVPVDTVPNTPKGRGKDSVTVQDRTQVPDVRGFTTSMVTAAMQNSYLTAVNLGEDYSDEVAAGRVFRQSPRAGTEVVTRTTVALWYSKGPSPRADTVRIPSVVGLELVPARDSLRRSGFQAGRVEYIVRPAGENMVIQQLRREGSAGRRGEAVDLTIATPPTRVPVPSVLGLTREGARSKLGSSGLGIGRVTIVVRSGSETGIVSQKPSPKTMVDSGTLIDVVESRPPEVRVVRVPGLVGKPLALADSILRGDSLVIGDVVRLGTNAGGTVTYQNPTAGQSVSMHSPVSVALGAGPLPPPVVPNVITLTVDSARRMLADSGFTRVSIDGRGEPLTSASVVQSQNPRAGSVIDSGATISLVAITRTPDPVPNLVGRKRDEARMIADINNLALIVTSEVRRLRLNDEVVSQVPVAQSPRRADNTVAVVVEIPAVPPPLAALLGLVVVAGGIAAIRTPKPKPGNGTNGQHPEPPKPGHVILKPVTGPPTPVVLNDEGHKTLVSAAFTLHFDVLNDPMSLTTDGNSLVKSEEWHNG